jgi:hypothetical protein
VSTINKILYATSTSITLTAPGTGAARESNSVDNGTNRYDDVLVRIAFTAGTVSANKQAVVYVWGSEDGTNFESVVTGSDAAITLRNPESMRSIVIPCPTSSVAYKKTFNLLDVFSSVPRKWGLVFLDDTLGGVASLAVSYTGISFEDI